MSRWLPFHRFTHHFETTFTDLPSGQGDKPEVWVVCEEKIVVTAF
jgi:hypothetical protein